MKKLLVVSALVFASSFSSVNLGSTLGKQVKTNEFNPIRIEKEKSYTLKRYPKYKISLLLDGDTLEIQLREGTRRVRLAGIDCFETQINKRLNYQKEKFNISEDEILLRGNTAKEYLETILKKEKQIRFELTGIDHYSRLVGFIYQDKFLYSVNINKKMYTSGYCPSFVYIPNYQH